MLHSVGHDAPFGHGLSSQPFQSEVVVLVFKVRDWKDSNFLLAKLQILLSVSASKRLSALGLYRFIARTRACFKQTGNQLKTFTWFEAMLFSCSSCKMCQRRALFTTLVLLCMIFVQAHQRSQMSTSMTLNVHLNNANECPVYEHTHTRWPNTARWYCPAFHHNDAIAHKLPTNA